MEVGDSLRRNIVDNTYNGYTWLRFREKTVIESLNMYFAQIRHTSLYSSDGLIVRNIYRDSLIGLSEKCNQVPQL